MMTIIVLLLSAVLSLLGPSIPGEFRVVFLEDRVYRPGAVTWVIELWNLSGREAAPFEMQFHVGRGLDAIYMAPMGREDYINGSIAVWKRANASPSEYIPAIYIAQGAARRWMPLVLGGDR